MSNQDYISYQDNVAEVNTALIQMGRLCGQLELEDSRKAIEVSRHKLTSHKFSVGIMGELKRGKSTVVNALLGREIMPADILPATATLVRVTYDLNPHAKVIKNDGSVIEIPVDELADYVTIINDENAKRAEMVDEAIVYYPCPFCKNGVDIVDSPGLNNDERMDKISEKIIPKLDAVIMVVVPGAPFSKSETEFVCTKLKGSSLGRLFFLVNKIDTIRPEERVCAFVSIKKRIQTAVLDRILEIYGEDSAEYADMKAKIENVRIFPISAADALDARLAGDDVLLKKSGIIEFEDALKYMLTTERGALELAAPLAVLFRTATEVLNVAETRKNGLQLSVKEFEQRQRQAMLKIAEFRNGKKQETTRINNAAQKVKANLLPQIREFYDALEKELNDVIEQIPIDRRSLLLKAGRHAVSQKIQEVVNATIKIRMTNFSERMQKQIMVALGEQAAQSTAFTTDIIEELNSNVRVTFAPPSGSPDGSDLSKNAVGLAGFAFDILTDLAGGPWGLTGLVKGYQEAGLKDAAVGLAAGVATTFGIGLDLNSAGIVGLPLCIIAIVARGATGKFAANFLFPPNGDEEYQTLIDNIRKQINESVVQMRVEGKLEHTLSQRIEDAFGSLAAAMNEELEKVLHGTEQTLDLIKQDLTKNILQREQASKVFDEVVSSVSEIMTHLEPVMKAIQSGHMAG